jgi:putative DNA primase/helicase
MPTGLVSGLFVVDCDTKEAIAMMEAAGLTPHNRTRKGYHYYVRCPSWMVSNSSRLLPGVDIRGQGGYVNFCGENGKASYKVLIMPTDDSLYTVEQLPAELQKALKPKPETLADRMLQEALNRVQPENRNETGLWLACQLRDNGLTQTEAESVMLHYAAEVGNSGDHLYTESEALASLEQAFTRPAREPWHAATHTLVTGVFNLTDLGNAERLAKYYGHILHYCYERKRWLVWNRRVWEWDMGDKITALAKETVRNIYDEAADEPDEKRRKELASHAKSSESDHRINAMISLAESESGIPVKVTELDTNPWLFNCLNGTIDLRTGQLLPHRKEDLLTIIVAVEYHPDAPCPRWLTFLNRVTDGNTELQGYLQRAIGYSLTGDTKSQVLFFLYELGNNGKSTFSMTIRKVMGGYGERLDADDLMVKD